MTVCLPKRDRCRLCFSLILRDRSTLFSSICCQKYYHIFKHIQRTKIPIKQFNSFKTKISTRTVCFRDLICRYLHTQIEPIKNFSNFICYDCSRILLEIEQCAKHLRKTVNQLKMKFNKSNRLVTSSLSATIQKKKQRNKTVKIEQLPIVNSDEDEEFDDIDDDEESDDDLDDTKPIISTNRTNPNQSKSLHYTSSSPLIPSNTSRIDSRTKNNNNNNNNHHHHMSHDDEDNDADDDEEDDEEEEEEDSSITKQSSKFHESKQKNLPDALHPTMPSLDETNPHLLQLRFAQMMANVAAMSSSPGMNNNGADAMMNTFANMQRNLFLKLINDPVAAVQAASAAAASASQIKANLAPISLMASHNKQTSSCRKRKSTPEKRVLTNHRTTNNNGDTSPIDEHESLNNSTENIHHQDITDHPLELTVKSLPRSNRLSSSTDAQNLVINSKNENGISSNVGQFYQHIDEDQKESTTPNESSLSSSPSGMRRAALSKRKRFSTNSQYEYSNTHNNLSMVNLPPSTTDLLSPNHHHHISMNDDNNNNNNSNMHQRQQQRKLDPRSCAECGKVLFSDKTLLLHCQTHAKNEKQCWICGINDEAIKKHILNEHGNQKFTNTGFRCQHCDKVFPVFADLETHTKEHSKKKPFECPICNKRFGQQGNLSCHLRIHSGVKPFTCTSCGKAFRHSNSLRRHARTVHSVSRGLTTPTNSLLLPNTTTSLSNDFKNETFDDVPSALMIPSDDGSSSSGDVPSPSVSNAQVDSD